MERGGGAFGSGSHPTTQMCLSLLLGLEPEGAARPTSAAAPARWASPPPASAGGRSPRSTSRPRRSSSGRNAQTNGVEIDASQADLRAAPFPPRELLLVNAPPPVQERVAAAITPDVRHVIVSGIVEGELPEVRDRYAEAGFAPKARSGRGHVGRGPDGASR